MHYYNYHPYDEQTIDFNKQRHPANLGFSNPNEFKDVNINKINGKLLDNIVEYNKNLTEDEINGTNVNNIVKYNNLLTLSEFDKMTIAKQYEKLYGKSRDANIIEEEKFENSKFTNLSLNEIFHKFTYTMVELLHEIPKAYEHNTLNIEMFTKEDRPIYIGILFLIISFIFYFINISS